MNDPINNLPLPELFRRLVKEHELDALLESALREDLGDRGDVTSDSLISSSLTGEAQFTARGAGVLCGLPMIERLFQSARWGLQFEAFQSDGDCLTTGQAVARVSGPLRRILAVERTALNFLCHLSGVATLTAGYVREVTGTQARIYDTRKTIPGLRRLAKYAVRCGGGYCHRLGLHDAMLVKDNHIAHIPADQWAIRLSQAMREARAQPGGIAFAEVEVDTLDQLLLVLPLGADMVLLDNMSIEQIKQAVELRDRLAPHVELEASGGVNLQTVRAVARTGVNRVAVGAITHSAPALDIGLDIATA